MSDPQPQVVGRLVKMDGEWKDGEIPEHPEQHPACSEIIEFKSGEAPKVVYRRDPCL